MQSWGWWFETPSRPLWFHCRYQNYKPGVPSCTVFFTPNKWFIAEGHWGGDFVIASDTGAVNVTAGGGWAAAMTTLLSGCCNMILEHLSSGFQHLLPSNDVKDLRKCVSFGSMNVLCVYHCDLWISYACIICNVIYIYIYICILLICECYNYVYVPLWSAKAIWIYHLICECHITCMFCIPFTYNLLDNEYLFIVIVIVIIEKYLVIRMLYQALSACLQCPITKTYNIIWNIDGSVQDFIYSLFNPLELLESCPKPSIQW